MMKLHKCLETTFFQVIASIAVKYNVVDIYKQIFITFYEQLSIKYYVNVCVKIFFGISKKEKNIVIIDIETKWFVT